MLVIDPTLSAAIVGLLVALCGLATAVCINLAQQVRTNKLDINGLGRKVQAHAEVLAGSGKRNVTLPQWDQLTDPRSDGTLAPDRVNECGEECVAEVIQWAHGVEVSADALRYELRGATGSALTDAPALVKLLVRNNVWAAERVQDTAGLQKFLLSIVNARRLCIVLGNWVSAGVPHWVIVTNASEHGVTVNDPWGGRHYNIAWADFRRLYLGSLVEIISLPDAPVSQ